jgi:glycosyltransferase involved in cell wall biosynthesis
VRVERALGARTDRIVAVSPSEAALIGRLGIAPDDRVATITNGVDLVHSPQPELDLRSSLGVAPGTPLVGTVTRLVRQKAPELFIRAAAIVARTCPDAHFVLVGSGPLRARVEIEAELTGLRDRFHLVPVLPYAGLTMGQLDVFVLASRFEGCPYSPLEAMRAGTPVVLSDVVGNRDVIEPGVSGLLVPADDPTALASGVSAALTDQNLRSVLVSGARDRLRRRFDVRLMGMALGALYSDLAQKHEDPHRLARLLTAGFAPWRGESRT